MVKKDDNGDRNRVVIHRTEEFDALMTSIVNAEWQLAGTPPSEIDNRVERIITHITAMRRDVQTGRGASGDNEVIVYRSVGADHLAHALAYAHVALEITGGSSMRFRRIGGKKNKPSGKKEGKVDKKKNRIIRIR